MGGKLEGAAAGPGAWPTLALLLPQYTACCIWMRLLGSIFGIAPDAKPDSEPMPGIDGRSWSARRERRSAVEAKPTTVSPESAAAGATITRARSRSMAVCLRTEVAAVRRMRTEVTVRSAAREGGLGSFGPSQGSIPWRHVVTHDKGLGRRVRVVRLCCHSIPAGACTRGAAVATKHGGRKATFPRSVFRFFST